MLSKVPNMYSYFHSFCIRILLFHQIKKKKRTPKGIQESTKILIIIKIILVHQGKT